MKKFLLLGAVTFSVACLETEKDPDDTAADTGVADTEVEDTAIEDTADTADTADVTPATVSALVTWDADGMNLELFDIDTEAQYYFGIAQTNGLTNNEETLAAYLWTAEDCHYGYVTGDTDLQWCHVVPSGSYSLRLDSTTSTSDVTEEGDPQVTYLEQEDGTDGFTYFLEDASNGNCYVWGDSVAYYDDYVYACEVVSW